MDRQDVCARFLDAVPHALYPFQEEALLAWFDCVGGLLVTAPTGMGKTLIAEAAVFEALATGRRAYYTTPLIALTDQKFREFQDRAEAWGFSRDDVGLITGNRKVNPQAPVKIVVAEILLNHLLAGEDFSDVAAVVMDEFHWFNDPERGVVWELALVIMPASVRLMLLSATVGNAFEFTGWLREKHGRKLALAQTQERRIPLDFIWVEDRLLTEHLPVMIGSDDATSRVPALVFCFIRDECWEVAERLKGLPLIGPDAKAEIEAALDPEDFRHGIGPKLRAMLLRGVGVHHAGVLPRYKEAVEALFSRKLIPFVVCTETLAAGVNLPARSVVLSTLLKGKPRERKVIPPSVAHQIFGRAGRPQFDVKGYVYSLAHEDDVRIWKWRQKYDQIDPRSKEPGILKAKKDLERKKPSRRTTEQYWTEGQFQTLIKSGPANLFSKGMIPYQFLIFLLARSKDLARVRTFLKARFNVPERLEGFVKQLDAMIDNLAAFGFLARVEGADTVEVKPEIEGLLAFRSVEPLYGAFLAGECVRASFVEKLLALESVLPLPPGIGRAAAPPDDLPKGPLQEQVLEPLMTALGVKLEQPKVADDEAEEEWNPWKEEEERPPRFADMLKLAFEAKLAHPEEIQVQNQWVAGGVFDAAGEFHKFVGSRSLAKNEGLVFRHLLRLVILAGEFHTRTQDPDYAEISERATGACRQVDPTYTERFLQSESEAKKLFEA